MTDATAIAVLAMVATVPVTVTVIVAMLRGYSITLHIHRRDPRDPG